MSNAYDKLDRRLKGDEPPSPGDPSGSRTTSGGQGYIAPGHGYVPASRPQTQSAPAYAPAHSPASSVTNDSNHPLHRHYRKRIRGIRARWLGSGLLFGALLGIMLTLLVSALVITQFPSALPSITGDPDVAVVIGENYLNREAANRLQAGPVSVAGLQVTGIKLDLKPGNRMDLQPQFTADLLITKLNFTASVQNQLSVQNGQLVINMVGDPQLGDLNVPLEILPFNLKDSTRQAVDQIDNDMIAAEINKTLGDAASGGNFTVQSVSTTETGMTINMQQK